MSAIPQSIAYKESGVQWLGKIPTHWRMIRLGIAYPNVGSGTTPKSDAKEYYDNGNIVWINSGDLNDSVLSDSEKKITNKALEDYPTLKMYLKDSIVVAMYGATIGKTSILDVEACVNQACCVLPKSGFFEYSYVFYWFIGNKKNIIEMGVGGGQPNISQEIIRNLKIPLPPLQEQQAIADFLDKKTRQIEEFITKKQKLITLLEEKKQTLINQCVTQGLDSSTPLKDSGVEWLGKIPTHWEVRKLKYVVSLRNQKEGESDFRIGLENIESKTGRFIQADESAFDDEGIGFFEGDVLFGKLRPYLAKVFLADKNGICVSEFLVLKSEGILNRFLKFLMLSGVFIEVVNSSTYGTKMPRANWEFIGNLKIPIPPLEEQKAIAEYLDTQIEKIDLAICKIKSQINLIKEYKITLISEAVCGRVGINLEKAVK